MRRYVFGAGRPLVMSFRPSCSTRYEPAKISTPPCATIPSLRPEESDTADLRWPRRRRRSFPPIGDVVLSTESKGRRRAPLGCHDVAMSRSFRPYVSGLWRLGLAKRVVGVPLLHHVCVLLVERPGADIGP